MRIAIAHPHPAPLALGGAENLFWGLQQALEQAGHRCDIIGQISPERSLREVLESYLGFMRVDLDAYDCVVSGKYPAWMVRHPDHRIYMLHRLRGLYDTYGGPGLAPELAGLPELVELDALARGAAGPAERLKAERAVEALLRREAELPPGAFAYPGPLARALVHRLDALAFAGGARRRFAAISRTVAERPGYFPARAPVEVLHPPPHRQDYRCGGDDYLFTSSRLDGPKRIALLIEAMRLVPDDIPLLIAGTGPERERLEALAGGDPRIRFLGFVPDDDMPGLYADALAVPFIPFDEDYGLVTVEAMKSGKPVLTVTDSGGPREFVEDGVTGLLCAPEPAAIAAGLSRLAGDREQARLMGQAAAARVESVTWERVVEGLLGPRRRPRSRRRRKLVVATTLPIYPPQGGGQARVFHLYRHVARAMDVEIVSFGPPGSMPHQAEIAPGLVETRIGKSVEHNRLERKLMTAMGEIPVSDVAMPRLSPLTPDYGKALAQAARHCDALIACHPYLGEELEAVAKGRPLWFEAQDVELSLKRAAFAAVADAAPVLADVERAERRCWQRSRLVFACTQADLAELGELYGETQAHLLEVANGVALDEIAFTAPAERRGLRARFGFGGRMVALFLGSWHPPNLAAVEAIIGWARQVPEVLFLVAGSAGTPFMGRDLPENCRLLGPVSHEMRGVLLASADIALNPMSYGSGSNLKMLDYFAAGVPVLSTPFGARGLSLVDGVHAWLRPLEDFPEALRAFRRATEAERAALVEEAVRLVRERFSWQAIAAGLVDAATSLDLFSPG